MTRTQSLLTLAAVLLFVSFSSTSAAAAGLTKCEADEAKAIAGGEAGNAAGDAAGDAIGALGLPVSDEGLQEQGNQENVNLSLIGGYSVAIADAVCSMDGVISTPVLNFVPWAFGSDPLPDPLTLPEQVSGLETAPTGEEVATANEGRVLAAEADLSQGAAADLRNEAILGAENEEGAAMGAITSAKAAALEADAANERIRTATNIKDIMAANGASAVATNTLLARLNENIAMVAAGEAQSNLNKADEAKAEADELNAEAAVLAAWPSS